MSDGDPALEDEARALLARVQDPERPPDDRASDLAEIDALLARDDGQLPRALSADLMVVRGATLAYAQRTDEALQALEAAAERFADDDELVVAQIVAFAWVTRINILVGTGRLDEAAEDGRKLLALFERQPDGPALAGFATMLLDVAFWLLSQQRDVDVLAISEALVARLADGEAAEQAVAAGARFFAAQAAGRLGDLDGSRAFIEELSSIGEPALVALARISNQFGDTATNPSWHAQIAASTVTVLWRMGRSDDARELAYRATGAFMRLGHDTLAQMLQELGRELADD